MMTNQFEEPDEVPIRAPERRAEAQVEIDCLPSPDDPAFLGSLVTADEPETLVYGIRQMYRLGRAQECQPLWERLVDLIRIPLAKSASAWNIELREDAMQDATLSLFKQISDLSPNRYLVEHNTLAVISKCVSNAARKLQRQRGEWERRADELPLSFDELLEDGHVGDEMASKERGVEDFVLDALMVSEIVNLLPENVARVVLMLQSGLQIESKDPTEPTVSRTLGVTPRTVRNYIQKAREILAPTQSAERES